MPKKLTLKRWRLVFFVFLLISVGVFFSWFLRGDYNKNIDEHSLSLISKMLDQSEHCKEIAESNFISDDELRLLESLRRHEVMAYSGLKVVEKDLECQAVPMGMLMYTGWLLKNSRDDYNLDVDLAGIASQYVDASITLSVEHLAYISRPVLETLDGVEYFKSPFVFNRVSLKDGGRSDESHENSE